MSLKHSQGLLDIEEQCRGFLDLAKAATALLVKSMFNDPAFLDLFTKLCCSDDWKQGTTTASILATLGDYLEDFKRMLEDAFFKRYPSRYVVAICHRPGDGSLFVAQTSNLQRRDWRCRGVAGVMILSDVYSSTDCLLFYLL